MCNEWHLHNIEMIERIIIVKTFILSKLWYVARFLIFNKKQINRINRIIFKFIWNNRTELIKRNAIIRDYGNGGLKMVHVDSKLNAIQIKEFISVFKNNGSIENEYLIYWLKFQKQKLEPKFLTNFNNIPFGLDTEIPSWYKVTSKLIPIINKLWPQSRIYSKMTTKSIYSKLKESA